MANFGQITWDENVSTQKFNKDEFLRLEDGHNTLRIVTAPYKYKFHKEIFDNDINRYGHEIKCCGDNCPLCAKGLPVKDMFVVGVLSKKGKNVEYKKLKFKTQVYGFIQGIRAIEGYKDMTKYDLVIMKNSKGGPTNTYQVIPGAPTPLSAEEIAMIDRINEEELAALCVTPTPEEVQNTRQRIINWLAKQKQGNTAQPVQDNSHSNEKAEVTDDMFNFKSVKK